MPRSYSLSSTSSDDSTGAESGPAHTTGHTRSSISSSRKARQFLLRCQRRLAVIAAGEGEPGAEPAGLQALAADLQRWTDAANTSIASPEDLETAIRLLLVTNMRMAAHLVRSRAFADAESRLALLLAQIRHHLGEGDALFNDALQLKASLLYQTNRMSEGEALLQRAMRHSISIDAATVIHKSLSRSTSARAHSFTRAPRKAARSTSLQA